MVHLLPLPEPITGYSAGTEIEFNEIVKRISYNRKAFVLDLYEYVRIRDLQQKGSYLLNDPGIDLLASVAAQKVEEILLEGNDPNLPYFLFLGDSISNQYSISLRESLQGKANYRGGGSAFNAQPDWASIVKTQVSEKEKKNNHPFDVIHFNWGLHASKYIDKDGKIITLEDGGQPCVPLERYEKELDTFVTELKKAKHPDCILIWASTTPTNHKANEDISEAYNNIAKAVMARHNIPVNDLYAFVKENKLHHKVGDCHFSFESAAKLGQRIAEFTLRTHADQNQSP